MKTSLKSALIVFALLFTSMQIFAQDTYNLNFKFEKGKTYFYRTTANIEVVQNMMGQEINIKVESKSKMRLDIADATASQFDIITSFDSVYSKSSDPMGGEDKISNGENIVGKKTKMIYNQFGKKLQKITIDAVAAGNDMTNMGNSNLLFQLSEKPVKTGDVWNVSSTDTTKTGEDGKMIIKSDTEYKLEGKEKVNGADCLKISFKAAMKIEGNMTQQGMSIVMEGTGKTTGTYFFDYAKGLMLTTDSGTNIDMTAAIPDQNITIPITQTMKAKVELTEK
jgi:hypothetical protein